MRTITKIINLYNFDELSEKAKEKVLNTEKEYLYNNHCNNLDDFICDCLYNYGVEDAKYNYSLGYSQGDGVCFYNINLFSYSRLTSKDYNKRLNKFEKEALKSLNEKLNKILAVEEAKSVYSVDIYIDWKRSQTWGWCPRAYITTHLLDVNKYHYYEKLEGYASGCGYDKLSSSIACALNGSNAALKLLYEAEEKRLINIKKGINQTRRDFIGYGSGYGCLPYFEGGVGFESQYTIFKKLGYNIKITRDNHGDMIGANIE